MSRKLTVGSCFSGIGGLELGLEWTGGFETKWQIENDPYASAVLKKHWPNVKRYSDIREVFNPERVDVICGGFPCQDVSLAGARLGLDGKRSPLWSQMYRLVRALAPPWVLVENVPGLLSANSGRFFGEVLGDLADGGYRVDWGLLSAAGVGAPHLRRRIFIVAHTAGEHGWRGDLGERETTERTERNDQSFGIREAMADPSSGIRQREASGQTGHAPFSGKDVADANGSRFQHIGEMQTGSERDTWRNSPAGGGWWDTEPDVGRVAHGVPSRVDRLKCLGNAVVPQVAQKVGEMILNFGESAP